jgi:hypothetical protein
VNVITDYNRKLQEFVERLTADQKDRLHTLGFDSQVDDRYAYFESGRKFDKILITSGAGASVRYFVDKSDGTIYGSRSRLAPNLKWYFGTLDTQDAWYWGDFHGIPSEKANVIAAGQYGPYTRWQPK